MWSWQWIPKRMNSQKGFSLFSCVLAQSEIPWIQSFDKFRCVPRNLRSGVFFSFFKTKRKKDTLRAVVSPGRTLRPSWRNHCSQGRRRIAWSQDTCLLSSIAYTLNVGTVLVCGQRNHRFRSELSCTPKLVSPVICGRASYWVPVNALAAHPACNFSPEVLSWFYLFALKEKSTLL